MVIVARKSLWFLLFIGLFLSFGKIDDYYHISENYINWKLAILIAGVTNEEGSAEALIDTHELISMFYNVIIALLSFSFIRVAISTGSKKDYGNGKYIKNVVIYAVTLFVKSAIFFIIMFLLLYVADKFTDESTLLTTGMLLIAVVISATILVYNAMMIYLIRKKGR